MSPQNFDVNRLLALFLEEVQEDLRLINWIAWSQVHPVRRSEYCWRAFVRLCFRSIYPQVCLSN